MEEHKVTITALAKYKDVFDYFRGRLDEFVPKGIRKVVVVDGNEITEAPGWEIIPGPANFTMAGNLNVAWRAVESDSDILSVNDDVYFLEPSPIVKFQELAYSESKIGCVSAYSKIGLFGGPLQQCPRKDVPLTFAKTCTNTCAYFRRDMIDVVGYYDEMFNEKYSAEDVDYTYRVNLAGWKVGIARDLPCQHGYDGRKYSSTVFRALGKDVIAQHSERAIEKFKKKHGHFDLYSPWNW